MKKIFLLFVLLTTLIACGDDDKEDTNNPAYDRGALLSEWANDFIVPDFETAAVQNAKLVEAKNTFLEEATEANLTSLRESYLSAYKAFQKIEKYNIGVAEELSFVLNSNFYPTDVSKIQSNINNLSTVDLSNISNQDAQGFPALDYLINGLGSTNTEIIAFYTGAEKDNYLGYLSQLTDRIEILNNRILTDWKEGAKNNFINNTSSAVNGSVNVFLDKYINYFERRLRSAKVGVPLGHFTTEPFPNNIESLYKPEESKVLLQEAFKATREFYLGKNGNGSLSNTLKGLGNTELDAMIRLRFTEAETAINALNSNLKAEVNNTEGLKRMRATRDALQRIVILLKADVASAMSISILSPDSDSD